MESQSTTRSSGERLTRMLASRTPRRSFFGKVGRLSVAAVAGSSIALLLWDEPAFAATCADGSGSCGSQNSVSCDCLTGSNLCPSGTCQCGCWVMCDGLCGTRATQWCDCCDTSGCNKTCVTACGTTKPKCCFPKEWSGGCGTVNSTIIRCRTHNCTQLAC